MGLKRLNYNSKKLIKQFINKTKKFNKEYYFANENIKLNPLKTEKILKNLM